MPGDFLEGDPGTFKEAEMSGSKHIFDSAEMGGVGQAKELMKKNGQCVGHIHTRCQCTGTTGR